MMLLMGNTLYYFVMNASEDDLESLNGFVHRTFNSPDFKYFIIALRHIYADSGGMVNIFTANKTENSIQPAIHSFYETFFEFPLTRNTGRHIGDPIKGSFLKRITMFIQIIKVA